MKILHLDTGREMRGGQWQVLRLHRALIEAGHESLLMAREDGILQSVARKWGLPWEPLRPLRLGLRSRAFHLVHAHDSRSHTWGALFSRAPLVVSRRVSFPIGQSAASRWKYAAARRFLAVSGFVAEILVASGVDAQKVEIVHDAVDMHDVTESGQLTVAPYTLDPEKGMRLAQQAAERAGVSLVLSRDLEADLDRARVLVYLTQSEGLGSGILLGMARGVAVIASRVGGIPELIEDGVNGILVENEAGAVADALRRLTPELASKLGRAAHETVANRFTVQHMLNATLNSYQRVLND